MVTLKGPLSTSRVGNKVNVNLLLNTALKMMKSIHSVSHDDDPHLSVQHACNCVSQCCVVVAAARGSSAFSILSSINSADFQIVLCPLLIFPDFLPCLQPDNY